MSIQRTNSVAATVSLNIVLLRVKMFLATVNVEKKNSMKLNFFFFRATTSVLPAVFNISHWILQIASAVDMVSENNLRQKHQLLTGILKGILNASLPKYSTSKGAVRLTWSKIRSEYVWSRSACLIFQTCDIRLRPVISVQ